MYNNFVVIKKKELLILKKILFSFFIGLGFLASFGFSSTVEASSIDITSAKDSSVVISESKTADELIKDYASNQNVTYEQAKDSLFPQSSLSTENRISPYAINYRTLKKTLPKNAGFVYFYCQTDESTGSFRGINKIMNAGYSSGSKIYSGTFYYHLRDAGRINFILNGHLYNSGSTTVTGGGSVGIGASANAHISISTTSSYNSPLYTSSYLTF